MTHLSVQDIPSVQDLVLRLQSGEEMLLEQDGVAIGRLIPIGTSPLSEAAKKSPADGFGFLCGQVVIPDDIKTPFAADIEEMFYGNPDKFK